MKAAGDCFTQHRKDWALLRLLWRTPAALPGLGVFIWLAALCMILLGTLIWQLTWRLLRAASLLFVGYIWFSRGLHWVVQTIYRLCKRNPYKTPLRIAAQSLLGVMLLFSGLFIVEIWCF